MPLNKETYLSLPACVYTHTHTPTYTACNKNLMSFEIYGVSENVISLEIYGVSENLMSLEIYCALFVGCVCVLLFI